MSISSLNSTRPTYSVADSGDPLAVLREAFMAMNDELRQGLNAVSAEAQKAMTDYVALQKSGIGKRLKALTPTEDGTGYVLGKTLQAGQSLVDDLRANGLSLATQTAYTASFESRDDKGNVLSTKSLLLTREQFDALLKKGSDGGRSGDVRFVLVDNAAGGTDQYSVDFGDPKLVADKADVEAVSTGVDAKETQLLSVIDREMRRLTDMSAELIERLRVSERTHIQGRKGESDNTAQRMQEMLREVQKGIEERLKEISPVGGPA